MPWEISTAGSGTSGGGSTSPGGSNTQVQYNNAGSFAGDANLTYSAGVLTVGNGVSNSSVRGIRGADANTYSFANITDGQYLRRIGSVITGATISAGSTNASGINQSIQFNSGTNFEGSANLLWNNTTKAITMSQMDSASAGLFMNDPNGWVRMSIAPNAGDQSQIIVRGGLGTTNNGFFTGASGDVVNRAGYTTVGITLGGGATSRDSFLNRHSLGGMVVSTTVTTQPALYISGVLNVNQIEELSTASGVTIDGVQLKDGFVEYDAIRGIRESGGATLGFNTISNGQYLMRSGAGIVGVAISAGGAGTPGGSTTQIQYNNAGAFAGSANLVWDESTKTLTEIGELYIVQEGGHDVATPSFRVRDSSNNALFQIQGDGSLQSFRGTVSPVYRNALLNGDLNMNSTTAADRTYLYLAPISGDRSVVLRTSPEEGRGYVVSNIGTGNVLNVRGSAGGTIVVAVAPQFSAQVQYDGVGWVNIT